MNSTQQAALAAQLPAIKHHLEEHGWALIKGVYTPEEIADIRQRVFKSAERVKLSTSTPSKDMLSDPELGHLVYDDRLLTIVRYLLDTPRPLYLGEANYLLSKQAYYPTEFHKDSADREDANSPDWTQPYDMIRFGLYLQDHTQNSGGLFVRDKSHTLACVGPDGRLSAEWGEKIYLRTSPGDLAVWSFKTSHAGAVALPKFGWMEKVFSPLTLNRMSTRLPWLFEPFAANRIGIFMGFGNSRKVANRYLEYLKTRPWGISAGKSAVYSPETLAKVKDKFDILDVHSAVKDLDEAKSNQQHRDIPY